MTITKTLVSRVLQMNTEGVAPTFHSNREATLRLILGRDQVNPLKVVSVNQLAIEMRLLHSIISHILISKTDRFDFLSERDLIMMHYILGGRLVHRQVILKGNVDYL